MVCFLSCLAAYEWVKLQNITTTQNTKKDSTFILFLIDSPFSCRKKTDFSIQPCRIVKSVIKKLFGSSASIQAPWLCVPRLFPDCSGVTFSEFPICLLKLLKMQNPNLKPSPCRRKEDNRKDLYHLDIPQCRRRLSKYNIRPFSLQNIWKISPCIFCNRKVFFFCSSSFFCLNSNPRGKARIRVKVKGKM